MAEGPTGMKQLKMIHASHEHRNGDTPKQMGQMFCAKNLARSLPRTRDIRLREPVGSGRGRQREVHQAAPVA